MMNSFSLRGETAWITGGGNGLGLGGPTALSILPGQISWLSLKSSRHI